MNRRDLLPLPTSPATLRIVQKADNRFGAVLSSLYKFWTARDTAVRANAEAGVRRDAYTVITFGTSDYEPWTSVSLVLIFDISLTST